MFTAHSKRRGFRAVAPFITGISALLLTAALLAPTSGFASVKQTPPSTPGDFHVTAVTTNSVSFAWTASRTGSSKNFVYVIYESTGLQFNVGTGTSATITTVAPGETYSFYIEAVAPPVASAPSPEVTVTIPAPPPPPPIIPAAPVITSVSTTSASITVSWTEATPASELDGTYLLINGESPFYFGVYEESLTEWTVFNLSPNTTYSIEVAAESKTGNITASEPINVTTPAPLNTNAPTAPTGLTGSSDGGGEAIMSWNPSTSPNEPQSQIEYEVFVNGSHEVDSDVIGQTSQVYVFPNGAGDPQSVYVVAVDQYGNVSPPSNVVEIEF
jgi:hypothetical protein